MLLSLSEKSSPFHEKFGKITVMEFLIYLISRLPLNFLRSVGRCIGAMIYRFDRRYREEINRNLTRAGIYSADMAHAVAREQGAQAVEAPWVWGRSREEVLARCRIDESSMLLLQEALGSGRPIVFLTPHLGCYEVGPMMVAQHWLKGTDRQIAILYRVPRKSYLRHIVGQGRASENIVPASADLKGVRQILRIMKSGGIAGILPDQVPSHGEGVWVPLFGEKAYTMTFPLKLAKQFKAQIIMARMQRDEAGWCMHAENWTYQLSGDEHRDAAAMNTLIERTILQCPQQYLWSYKRYKCPRGVKREQ